MDPTGEIFGPINIFPFIKLLFVIFLVIYSIIALVVLKQINLMTRTIKSSAARYIYGVAYLHLAIVVMTLIFAVLVL